MSRTYDINVKAHYYTTQAFVPHMVEEGHGHVVVRRSFLSLSPWRAPTNLFVPCLPQTIASSTAYHSAATGVACASSFSHDSKRLETQ